MQPPPTKSRPAWARAWAWTVSLAFLLPNLWFVFLGRESFPFTSAPMFAHYIGPETPLFYFEFNGVTQEGALLPIAPDKLGRNERLLIRYFFSYVYGSTHPNRVFGLPEGNTPEIFAERMRRFFRAAYGPLQKRWQGPSLTAIQVHLVEIDRARKPIDRRVLGSYSVSDDQYTHLWKAR